MHDIVLVSSPLVSFHLLPIDAFDGFSNKRHAMHAEAMTFHKGSKRIFRKFDSKFQES